MRQAKFLELPQRYVLAVVIAAMLVPSAWAYINGGVYHSTLKTHISRLEAGGWTVSSGRALPDQSTLQDSVNLLVAQAVHSLPKEDAASVSPEIKREIARLAREAIEEAVRGKQQIIKKGQAGSLRYEVGAFAFDAYWETNYGGKRKIHARRSGLAPLVALTTSERTQAEARITVLVPADAEIFFDGESTTQTGSERLYLTPTLRIGKNYQYEIRARWREKGKTIEKSRKISMTGGDSVRVDFLIEE